MAKKQKGKVVQLKPAHQSPENYIKNQARSLPISECLITEDWEDTGICNIIVARQHKNGNITAGIYLVDLYCLGLKDAHYEFNLDPEDFEYVKENSGELKNCDYVLAHNIIYGAIAFAEDCGFKPHKDFAVAQYILEEDDDAVELMELEFGIEGIPFYAKGPYDNEVEVKQVKNTLLRTVGEGNFTVIEDIDDAWLDEDLDTLFDDDDEGDENDMPEEQAEMLEDLLYKRKPVNKVYEKAIRTAEAKEMLKQSTIGKGYRLSKKPVKDKWNVFDFPEQEKQYEQLLELFNNEAFTKAIKELKKAIIKYPLRPQFHNLLQACYIFSEQFDESNKLIIEMYKQFPDYLFAAVPYANMLIDNKKTEQVLAVFNDKRDLCELYPERKLLNIHEAAIYYATMCRYFIAVDNIDSADLYMNAIIKKDLHHVPNQSMVNKALMELCNAKILAIKDHLGF